MNFIQFTGNKKTNETFLKNIKSISNSPQSLLENLKSLNIFESLNTEKNKISLNECTNTFKMRMSSKGTKSIYSNFPNIFGNGENLTLNFQGLNDFTLQMGKPLFFKNQIVQAKLSAIVETKKINDKKIASKNLEISSKFNDFTLKGGIEKIQNLNIFYNQIFYKFLGCKIDAKAGFTKSGNQPGAKCSKAVPFCKLTAARKLSLSGENTFIESSVKIGKIFGQTTLLEKFFLGNSLKGYQKESIGPVSQNKKIGGNSFIEIKNKVGFFFKNFEVFAFGDFGVNSAKGLKECTQILTSFGDNVCIGKSVGFGCGMKDRKGPSFIFAVPFTTNPEAEPYSFGVDFEF